MSILTEADLNYIIDKINPNKLEWENKRTNCYAFALGLDMDTLQIQVGAYNPGTIGESKANIGNYITNCFPYKTLLNNLYLDFEKLRLSYRDIESQEEIENDEWKIALFTKHAFYEFEDSGVEFISDFHFLRQLENGIWYHKFSYAGQVTNLDFNNKVITSPEECYLRDYQLRKCIALKKKRALK